MEREVAEKEFTHIRSTFPARAIGSRSRRVGRVLENVNLCPIMNSTQPNAVELKIMVLKMIKKIIYLHMAVKLCCCIAKSGVHP